MPFHTTNFLFKSWPLLVAEKIRLHVFCDITLSFWVGTAFKMSWTSSTVIHCHSCKTSAFCSTTVRHSKLPEVMIGCERLGQGVDRHWEINRFLLYHRHLFPDVLISK